MISYVIGGVLAAAGIVALIIGGKRIKINNETIKLNKELFEQNLVLQSESGRLYSEIQFLRNQKEQNERQSQLSFENYCDILDLAYEAKEKEYDTMVYYYQNLTEHKLEQSKAESDLAFEKYFEHLEKQYEQAEQDYDVNILVFDGKINEYKEELEKIKASYRAAREAQLREEEMAQKEDFYSLHLTPQEQTTIGLIEELKTKIPETRPLCELIWKYFFQKQTNTLCNNILGGNPVCGIYKITNKKSGLCYVGQAVNVADRFKQHIKCGLGIDTPTQNKLYRAMLKEGVTNFTFELLEPCDRTLLNEKEKFYIGLYQAYECGYNSTQGNK